jgi:DNA modification methylase
MPKLAVVDRPLSELKPHPRNARTHSDAQPPAGPPVARAGDLWLMGEHRLYVGDTFNADDRALLLPGGMLGDCVVTDPPYAIYGSSTGIGADISDDKMVRPFFEAMARALANSVREFAHIYACCDWRSYATLWGGFKEARLSPKNCVVWDKGSAGLGNSYANTHEFVAFFARLPPQKAMQSNARRGQRPVHRPNIFRCNRVTGEERQHNAAKPVALLTFLIENSTDEGELVLDLFAGSGSTLIACQATGRRCAAMEIEPRYADTTVRRWQAFTGLQAHLGTPDGPTLSEIAVSRKGG